MLAATATLARRTGARVDKHLGWLGPLLLRITIAVIFIGTGWGKLHDLPKVVAFFTDLHIPLPELQARLVATLEFVGGICILLGLGTRLFAAPLAFTMIIAMLTAKTTELADVHGVERVTTVIGFEEWSYFVMLVLLAVTGPGLLSLDRLILRTLAGPQATAKEAVDRAKGN
jgi:putative oxidoreductase